MESMDATKRVITPLYGFRGVHGFGKLTPPLVIRQNQNDIRRIGMCGGSPNESMHAIITTALEIRLCIIMLISFLLVVYSFSVPFALTRALRPTTIVIEALFCTYSETCRERWEKIQITKSKFQISSKIQTTIGARSRNETQDASD